MDKPILFVKTGCHYCSDAMNALDERKIAYDKIEVRGDEEAMKSLKEASGQTRTPTLLWDGKVLSDFGIDDLEKFLAKVGADRRDVEP